MRPSALRLLLFAAAVALATLLWFMLRDGPGAPEPGPATDRATTTAEPADTAPRPRAGEPADGPDAPAPGSRTPRRTSTLFGGTLAEPSPRQPLWIRGRVVDGLGTGIAGCRVGLEPRPERPDLEPGPRGPVSAETRTGIDGRFEIEVLTGGRWTLSFSHPQFPPWLAALDLAGVAGPALDLGDLMLRSRSGLRIRVLADREGQPITDASVTLSPVLLDPFLAPLGRRAVERRGVTDRFGIAELYGIPAGEYLLGVAAAGWRRDEQRITRGATDDPAGDQTQVVRLLPEQILRGRVLDPDGRPLAAVRVVATPYAAPRVQVEDRSASDGSFQLTGLSTGSCRVLAHSERWPLWVQERVPVPGDQPLEIRLPRGHRVSGVVRERGAGTPVVDARVLAIPLDGTPVRDGAFVRIEARTDSNGRFELSGLRPGRTRVQVSSEGHGGVLTDPLETSPDGGQPLEVTLTPGIRLIGRVVDPTGAPLAEATLQMLPPDSDGTALTGLMTGMGRPPGSGGGGDLLRISVSPQGRIDHVLPLAPDRPYRLLVEAPGHGPVLTPVRRPPGPTDDLGELTVPASGRIQGRTLDEDGHPVLGAIVVAEPETGTSGGVAARTRSDAEGRYDLPGMAPGSYALWAHVGPGETSLLQDGTGRPTRDRWYPGGSTSFGSAAPVRRTVQLRRVEVRARLVTVRDLAFRAVSLPPQPAADPVTGGSRR